jgi:DNA-binding CsgD family transcriptional regulator
MARMLLSLEAMRTARSQGLTIETRSALPAHVPEKGLEPAEVAALTAALDEVPTSAFVIWADGSVALANAAGRAARELAPERVATSLLASLGGRDDTFRVRRIDYPGAPSHFVAVQQGRAEDPEPRVAAAVANWGVTPRQAEVLGLLALGQANKTIASTLGCAGGTVEIHVTDLLRKSGCQSRCELVSRFWSRPIAPVPQERSGLVDTSSQRLRSRRLGGAGLGRHRSEFQIPVVEAEVGGR